MEDEKKLLQKARNMFSSLKTDPSSVLFSDEKIVTRYLKNFENQNTSKTPCC